MALPMAAAALAAAKATAKGIVGLAGDGSHLDLLVGLPVSPSPSVGCRVLLLALFWVSWLGIILCLLPSLTQVPGEGPAVVPAVAIVAAAGSVAAAVTTSACLPAASAASPPSGTATPGLCPSAPASTPAAGTPERYDVSVWVFSIDFRSCSFTTFVPLGTGWKNAWIPGWVCRVAGLGLLTLGAL